VALKFTASHRKRIAAVLEGDHESLDDAVDAVMALMGDLIEDRASFVVVGQLYATRGRLDVPPSDPEAVKVCLGLYSTEGDARSAAESLWTSTASGDCFRTWWLPIEHASPAEWHKGRKEHYAALEKKRDDANAERIKKSIEKRQAEAQARADALREEQNAA
jgi:hypothetical protein